MNSSVYTVWRGVTCLNFRSNQEKMTCVSCSKRKKQNLMNLARSKKRANRFIKGANYLYLASKDHFSDYG